MANVIGNSEESLQQLQQIIVNPDSLTGLMTDLEESGGDCYGENVCKYGFLLNVSDEAGGETKE